jgi:hypothetical protein
MSLEHNKRTVIESFRLIETGDVAAAERIIAADIINREAQDNPDHPERNLSGPAGFVATARWLCTVFSDLRLTDMVTARHTGDFLGLPAIGKPIRQRQSLISIPHRKDRATCGSA